MTGGSTKDEQAFSICLVGAGNMGGAMLKGWLAAGIDPRLIEVIDPNISQAFAVELSNKGVASFADATDRQKPDVLVIAVKPQMMNDVLPEISHLTGPNTVAVSVAAGTKLQTLESGLEHPAVVRAMPNTPALVMRGMTVACAAVAVTEKQKARVDSLLRANGKSEWIEDESLMDAVTAVSGSGPAYIFHLAECMAAAGVKAGLPDALAKTLARETVSGAGELLHQATEDPAILRENVTSPGGTTAAALSELMTEGAMMKLFERAIIAARDRSMELS